MIYLELENANNNNNIIWLLTEFGGKMKEVDLKISKIIICQPVVPNLEKWKSKLMSNNYFLNLTIRDQNISQNVPVE